MPLPDLRLQDSPDVETFELLSETSSPKVSHEDIREPPSRATPRLRSPDLRTVIELITQSTPSLVAAIVGSAATGVVFDQVQFWPAFKIIGELFVLVPILLNLKGCLEMNLASRLSTAVLPQWTSGG
jgi:hypothetical protein